MSGRGGLLGRRGPDRLHARGLPAAAGGARPAAARAGLAGREPPSGQPDRRRPRRAGRDRREGRERARRSTIPPDRLEVIVASDGSDDRTDEIARASGRAATARAGPRPARGAARCRAGRRGRGCRRARSSPSRTRTRSGSRTRCGCWCARSPIPRSATCAGRSPTSRRTAPTRRARTGATRTPCARSRAGSASVTAGNGAIYAVRREAYLRLDPRTSHDLAFPFNLVQRGWRAVYEPARGRRAPGGDARERVPAQAPHDEPRLAGGPRRRPARPARVRGALRARDLLAPRAALRDAVPAPGRVRRRTWRCSGAGVYTVDLRRPVGGARGRGRGAPTGGRACSGSAATTC